MNNHVWIYIFRCWEIYVTFNSASSIDSLKNLKLTLYISKDVFSIFKINEWILDQWTRIIYFPQSAITSHIVTLHPDTHPTQALENFVNKKDKQIKTHVVIFASSLTSFEFRYCYILYYENCRS